MKKSFVCQVSWQEELSYNVTTAQELAERGLIEQNLVDEYQKLIDIYPMSITRYYLDLIKTPSDKDPIYRMCIPSLAEHSASGSFDTSGELSNTASQGIQHKYNNTVLLLSTNICAMYCRHCFRKRLVGQSEKEILAFADSAVEYVNSHSEVDNVLISGGDSLLNSNSVIEIYLKSFCNNDNIKFLRFGSRVPVVFPQRIIGDSHLLELFSEYSAKKQIYVVTQFNHPRELTADAKKAVSLLKRAGVPVLNQTVLLNGVNDSADILTKLFNGLVGCGVAPYYLFQCRPVKSVKSYFSLPLVKGTQIADETRERLSGIAKRFRYTMSHVLGKMEILGTTKEGALLLKQHQAKDSSMLNSIFKAEISPTDVWLPDDFTATPL